MESSSPHAAGAETADETKRNVPGRDVLADCRLMLKYALESGLDLSVDLQRDLAELDDRLRKAGLPTVAALPADLPDVATLSTGVTPASSVAAEPPADPPAMATPSRPVASTRELVLRVNLALSEVIAPATALTLVTTEPADDAFRVFARMPRIVWLATIAAIVSASLFVVSAGVIASGSGPGRSASASAKRGTP